jgi:hypothetical protein
VALKGGAFWLPQLPSSTSIPAIDVSAAHRERFKPASYEISTGIPGPLAISSRESGTRET